LCVSAGRISYEDLEWRSFCADPEREVNHPPPPPFFGQERVRAALELALKGGFHAYVVGPPGLGKHEALMRYLQQQRVETPPDLLYVPLSERRAAVLTLPSGRENDLAEAVEGLFGEGSRLEALFRQRSFLREKSQLESRFRQQQEEQIEQLRREAQAAGFSLLVGEEGLELSGQGSVPTELAARLEEVTLHNLALSAEAAQALRRLRREWVHHYLNTRIEPLIQRFPQARAYLEALRDRLARAAESGEDFDPTPWRPNLLTSSSSGSPPPVVFEPYATAPRLFGRLDYHVERGVRRTHVGLIRPGAIHRAQGGFLILDASSLVREGTWEAFKRTLRNGRVEPVTEADGPGGLEVEPFPVQVQTLLVGSHEAFEPLEHDPAFGELFRIRVEFSPTLPATPEHYRAFGGWLGQEGFSFTEGALARLWDEGRRMAEQRDRFDARLVELRAIAEEASVLAEGPLRAEDIERAVAARNERAFHSEEEFLRMVKEGTWNFQLQGKAVGQVNALVVLETNPPWGRPSRLTARAAPGRDGVLSIDREAGLGGHIFHKAVLELSGYLRGQYAEVGPFSATVSLVFEQNYASIEGDSAGLAELLAILSAIGQVPLRQDLGVTGAVDQSGQVLAVGAVTAKVEGFFRLCQAQGLTGEQGVVIPRSNLSNLTLSREVLEAVRRGRFHLYAVGTVDEAIELLTGRRAEGFGGVHEKVRQSLERFRDLENGGDEGRE
jgi:predicted ATP-dependent protease